MSFNRFCMSFQMTWFSSLADDSDVSSVRIFHSSILLKQFFNFLFHVGQSDRYFNEVIFAAFSSAFMGNIIGNTLRWGRLISSSDVWGFGFKFWGEVDWYHLQNSEVTVHLQMLSSGLNFHLRINFSWKQQLSTEVFLLCLISCLNVMWVTEFERKWMVRININQILQKSRAHNLLMICIDY